MMMHVAFCFGFSLGVVYRSGGASCQQDISRMTMKERGRTASFVKGWVLDSMHTERCVRVRPVHFTHDAIVPMNV